MADQDPRQMIIGAITQPAGRRTITGQGPGGWQKVVVSGGPYASAIADSIRFLKERRANRRRLYALSYTDDAGMTHLDYAAVEQGADGSWSRIGGAGGSGSSPTRAQPWVNFAGGWGEYFWAGGRVTGTGAERARDVHLAFSDGTTLQDSVDDGLVLFIVDHTLEGPATTRILDSAGNVLAEHPTFGAAP